jgi:glyoxylase-like metal-dependent hydrolase (beta-lactamase superfamily II)
LIHHIEYIEMRNRNLGPLEDTKLRPQPAAHSGAPSVHPGPSDANVFSFEHGAFEISVISDGYIEIPEGIFTSDAAPNQRKQILCRLDTKECIVHAPTNIPVLRFGDELILFDLGGGTRYRASDGRFLSSFRSAGLDPAAVTKVVFTHAHPDHTGATLTSKQELQFPNATYFVSAAEWDYWMDPDFFRKAPNALHEFGRGARRDLGAVKERAVMLRPGDDVIGGIRAIDMAGHTPGHLAFEIAGEGGLIIAADAATSEIVGFEHPGWHFGYDTIPELAVENRKRLLDRASADNARLLGFHWTNPGLGFAEAKGTAYRFVSAT